MHLVTLRQWTHHSLFAIADFVDTVNLGLKGEADNTWIGLQDLTSKLNLFNIISTDAQLTDELSAFTSDPDNITLFKSLTDRKISMNK